EILDAWLNTREIDPTEVANIEKVKSLDEHRRL
ncbi:MAG: RpiB/LacA/LacB family sugar-phosphate isomerase, partial [Chloroflexi bacterium]|nr:RpiB/LacA/LacB family sugar-phosphate isomerase [Chloroflexota bacterium]